MDVDTWIAVQRYKRARLERRRNRQAALLFLGFLVYVVGAFWIGLR